MMNRSYHSRTIHRLPLPARRSFLLSCLITLILLAAPLYNPSQRVAASPSLKGANSPDETAAGGLSWKPLGPYGGAVQSIVFSPAFASDHTVFAAVSGGGGVGHGVFRSTDGGLTWRAINNGLSATVNNGGLAVTALAVSPVFPTDHTLFAASVGLWRSTDGGDSWSVLSAATFNAQALALSPNFAVDRTIFAYAGSTVYRSIDGGATWQSSSACCGNGLAVSPDFVHDQTVFAGLTRSKDGGATFIKVISGFYSGETFAFSPGYLNDHTLFHGDGGGGILKSIDKGDNWTPLGNVGSNINTLAISPLFASDHTLWTGISGQGVKRSIDGGETWSPLVNGLPGNEDSFTLALSPAYPSDHLLLAGMLSGLYRSADQGNQWVDSQAGLYGLQAKQVMVSSGFTADGTLFVSAGKDSFKSTNWGATWQRLHKDAQGFGILAAISPDYPHDHTVFAIGNQNGQLYRSTDGGNTWSLTAQPAFPPTNPSPAVWAISPQYAVHPVLWAAAKVSSSGAVVQLARSADGAQSWSPAVEVDRWDFIQALALAPDFDQHGHALIAAESGFFSNGSYAGFYATTNGGDTWPYNGLWSDCYSTPQCWPKSGFSVAFSPAYASDHTAFIGTRSAGVWFNTQGIDKDTWMQGSSTMTQIVYGLALSPAFSSDGQVWAGTFGAGAFTSTDRGAHWSASNTGLGDLRILAVAAAPNITPGKTVFAATESGLWVYGAILRSFLPFTIR